MKKLFDALKELNASIEDAQRRETALARATAAVAVICATCMRLEPGRGRRELEAVYGGIQGGLSKIQAEGVDSAYRKGIAKILLSDNHRASENIEKYLSMGPDKGPGLLPRSRD